MSVKFELIRPWSCEIIGQEDHAERESAIQKQEWLGEYYRIREECFRRELGIRAFNGSEDCYDRSGYILIARIGGRCIGGARITGSSSTDLGQLPMERNGFMVLREFPQIAHSGSGYCQWTRLALLPEFRTTETLRNLTEAMINAARSLGYSYAFIISGLNRSRLYRRLYNSVGYRFDILKDFKIPEESGFSGLEHLLSVGYLDQKNGLGAVDNHCGNRPQDSEGLLRVA